MQAAYKILANLTELAVFAAGACAMIVAARMLI